MVSALAGVTNRIVLSHATLCQGFRNPALLAKMSATLQEISGGRFILTLGAGWDRQEFEAYGFGWYEHDIRIARTKEQIEIIKSLWTKPITNFEGSFYSIKNGILEPKPDPMPEIWYGGESIPSLKLAANLADGWLLNPSSIDEIISKVQMFESLLDRRKVKYVVSSHVIIGDTDEEARTKLREISGGNLDLERRIEKVGLVGSPEKISEKINLIKQAGIDTLLLRFSCTYNDIILFSKSLLKT